MPDEVVSAIVLRRVQHGDADIIATLLTREFGKIAVIGKGAQHSAKRFAGTLELFVHLQAVLTPGRGGMLVLKEASLINAFEHIRENIYHTAYASYWTELLLRFLEERHRQPTLFDLLKRLLESLNANQWSVAELNILFQIRFLAFTGYLPHLATCGMCQKPIEEISQERILFSVSEGMLLCDRCSKSHSQTVLLSVRTIKQLLWMITGDLNKAFRARLAHQSQEEGTKLLETFIPFHTQMKLKSLHFLQQIREDIG